MTPSILRPDLMDGHADATPSIAEEPESPFPSLTTNLNTDLLAINNDAVRERHQSVDSLDSEASDAPATTDSLPRRRHRHERNKSFGAAAAIDWLGEKLKRSSSMDLRDTRKSNEVAHLDVAKPTVPSHHHPSIGPVAIKKESSMRRSGSFEYNLFRSKKAAADRAAGKTDTPEPTKKSHGFHDLVSQFSHLLHSDSRKSMGSGSSSRHTDSADHSGDVGHYGTQQFDTCSADKYSKAGRVIGRGSGGTVRLVRRNADMKVFALKEFKKSSSSMTRRAFIKKLVAEYCVASNLHNMHVVETMDLLMDKDKYYEVMEYCPTVLLSVIRCGKMTTDEMTCYFRQLLQGVAYLHSMGVAHRDLKPENLVVNGSLLKIIDFGSSEVFQTAFEKKERRSKGIAGSAPYAPPEEYTDLDYDARKVDVWSCAIIFFALHFNALPWNIADGERDPGFAAFASSYSRQRPNRLICRLPASSRMTINAMLDLNPTDRPMIQHLLDHDHFVKNIVDCQDDPMHHMHHGTESYMQATQALPAVYVLQRRKSMDDARCACAHGRHLRWRASLHMRRSKSVDEIDDHMKHQFCSQSSSSSSTSASRKLLSTTRVSSAKPH